MPDVSFDEITAIVAAFEPLDDTAGAAAMARQVELGATTGADAVLASWIAGCQRRYPVRLDRPRVAVYAAAHATAPAETAGLRDTMDRTARGEGGLYAWCETVDADLRLYELALHEPAAALGETRAANAIAYGMMAVDDGTDIVAVAALNPAADAAGYALSGAIFDRGTPPHDALAASGAEDIAAIAGAIIAARVAGVPVLLEGAASWAAAGVVAAFRGDGVDHCALLIPGDLTPEAAALQAHLPAAQVAVPADGMRGESGPRAIADLRDAVAAHIR
jgi:nicotinate-nucleotide--dimethylbenzimidazole phosphoribosyltransferase